MVYCHAVESYIAGVATFFYGILQLNVSFVGVPFIYLQVGLAIAVIALNLQLILVTSLQEKELRRLGKVEQDFLTSWIKLRDEQEQGQVQSQATG